MRYTTNLNRSAGFLPSTVWPKRCEVEAMFGQQSAERFEKDRLMEEPTPGPGAYEVLPSDGKGVIMDTAERWYLGLLQKRSFGGMFLFCGVVLGLVHLKR